MTQEQATQLVQVYNALMMVNTNGKSSIIMGKCLESLENLLPQIKIEDLAQEE